MEITAVEALTPKTFVVVLNISINLSITTKNPIDDIGIPKVFSMIIITMMAPEGTAATPKVAIRERRNIMLWVSKLRGIPWDADIKDVAINT